MQVDKQEHGRFKGADWYHSAQNYRAVIGGSGGLGSWFSILLSRLTNAPMYIYDPDNFSIENSAGQFLFKNQYGGNKATVTSDNIYNFSNRTNVYCYKKYDENGFITPLMISCFDNMKSRKVMFNRWLSNSDSNSIFIDMRLIAESFTIFCIRRNDEDRIKKFQEVELYDSSEVIPQECTLKQTTHCAALCTSMAVGFLTNHFANIAEGDEYRKVPYKTEYSIALNLLHNEVITGQV